MILHDRDGIILQEQSDDKGWEGEVEGREGGGRGRRRGGRGGGEGEGRGRRSSATQLTRTALLAGLGCQGLCPSATLPSGA